MLLNIFKGRNPITLVLIPVMGLLLWIQAFTQASCIHHENSMPLYQLLKAICFNNTTTLNIIAFIILVINSFFINRLNETYIFIKNRTNLPGLIYIILACSLVYLKGMHPAIPASFFIILSIQRSFASHLNKNSPLNAFEIGFTCSIAAMFYTPILPYIIWTWIITTIIGGLKFKNVLANSTGFFVPIFSAASYYYLTDNTSLLCQVKNAIMHTDPLKIISSDTGVIGFFIFLGILSLVSILFLFKVFEEKKIHSRKYFSVLLSLFILTILQYVFITNTGIEIYFISIIPISYLISHYFVLQNSKYLGDTLFILLIIISFLGNYLL